MKFIPPLNTLPILVKVTVKPSVRAIAIFNPFRDDPTNETTVAMLIFIQNLPPASNAIGTLLSCSMNCWLSL